MVEKNNGKGKETFEFQAEIKQLLHILAYSLYTHKEIFIRELISNSADALNKIKYLELKNEKNIFGKGAELCVKIELDEKNNTITIKDTGIGMTKQEIKDNIGTIAKSGTKAFMEKISKDSKNKVSDIIGQFGVGFYSAFIVADKVEVTTKSYIKDEPAYTWISDGTGKYTIETADKNDRGTEVKVYLKKDEKEFTEKDNVESVIKKYSNFLRFPIYMDNKKINDLEAIWTKSPSSVKENEYKEFFKFISHGDDDPALTIHKKADAPIQFSLLLFAPKKNFNIFGNMNNQDYGLRLYTNKVLIQQQCKDLLPQYFRFIKGIVDSPDIPLNISRESFQNNRMIHKIKSIVTKSIISELEKMLKLKREDYETFYKEFNKEIKEGVHTDFTNKDKLAKLMLFNSSKNKDELITLKDYVDNKKNEQKEIYYISGPSIDAIDKSPYLEIFKKKDVEVLYLTDPADEIVLSNLMKFEDMEFKSIDNANLDYINKLDDIVEDNKKEKIEPVETKKLDKFIKFAKKILDDKVSDIQQTDRLIDSPCCLVNSQEGMSSHIEKMMKMMDKNFQGAKKILQVNPKNKLIKNLVDLYEKDKKSDLLEKLVLQLFDNALMTEGSLEKQVDTSIRVMDIMEETLNLKLKE